jgi:hypothetical protein
MKVISSVTYTPPWQSWTGSGFRCGGEVRLDLQKCEFT